MFQSADPYRLPPRSLALSVTLHAAAFALLCLIGFPTTPLHRSVFHEVLLAPIPRRQIPQPRRVTPPLPIRKFVAPMRRPLDEHKLVAPVEPPPTLNLDAATVFSPLPAANVPIQPIPAPVKTGTFETAAARTSIEPVSRSKPQLAGFGPVESASRAAPRGVRPLATGEFGDAQSGASSASHAAIASSSFGDATVASPARHASMPASAPITAVEILEKPRPAYTDEARHLNIQGEVLLEVVFEATGETRVLRVLHGLGHGLDEAAAAAARQIRFRPALREGQPVDSSAVVHILFQLAS